LTWFQSREHTIAVALGLPFLIHLRDCDLPPLSEADFREDEDSPSPLLSISGVRYATSDLPKQTRGHIHVTVKLVELTARGKCLSPVAPPEIVVWRAETVPPVEKLLLSLRDARSHHQTLEVLDNMNQIVLRDNFFSAEMTEDGFSLQDASTWTRHNLFPIFLLLYHERAVTLYHRRYEKALIGLQRAEFERSLRDEDERLSSNAEGTAPPFDYGPGLRQVRDAIFQSGVHVIEMLDKLRSRNLLRYAPPHV